MKWVAPIKDEMSIQRICSELEKIDQQYLVLFLVGIGTGLQLQEILNLRIRDIRGKDFITSSIGTRDVKRAFYIPADLRTVIDDFTKGKDEEGYLICGYGKRTAQPLSREQAYRVLKQAGNKAGQPELCAATMRKTFAWRYYRRTGDIYYIQDLMNHSSPSVTYRFIGIQPNHEIGIQRKSPQENARARSRLYEGGSGMHHIERIRNELYKIEEDLQSPKNPDAWFGKVESLLSSIDTLLDEFREV